MRFKSRFSAVLPNIFCRRKAAVVLRKVADGLRSDCRQCGSFAAFAVYLRFPEPREWEIGIIGGFCTDLLHKTCSSTRTCAVV